MHPWPPTTYGSAQKSSEASGGHKPLILETKQIVRINTLAEHQWTGEQPLHFINF